MTYTTVYSSVNRLTGAESSPTELRLEMTIHGAVLFVDRTVRPSI